MPLYRIRNARLDGASRDSSLTCAGRGASAGAESLAEVGLLVKRKTGEVPAAAVRAAVHVGLAGGRDGPVLKSAGFRVGVRLRLAATVLMPVDSAESLGSVVEEPPHLELEGAVVDAEAPRGTGAGLEDFRARSAAVDLQVRGAKGLPGPDGPDVKIVDTRHVPQGE